MSARFVIILTILIGLQSVTEAAVVEECLRLDVYLNSYTPFCNDSNLTQKYFVKFLNLTLHYVAMQNPSDKTTIEIDYQGKGLVLANNVGNINHSPSYAGFYRFSDDAQYTLQNVACNLTQYDLIPSGTYRPTDRNSGYQRGEYCDTDVRSDSLAAIKNFNILVNYDFKPFPCVYDGILMNTYYWDYMNYHGQGEALLCGILADNAAEVTTTTIPILSTVPTRPTIQIDEIDDPYNYPLIILSIFVISMIICWSLQKIIERMRVSPKNQKSVTDV